MNKSSFRNSFTLLSLTDDALIEIFRFLVLIDRHSDQLANGSWISLANTCPRLSLVYKSFLKTYDIEDDEMSKRLQRCSKCSTLYDHAFYLSITKLASPRITVLKIPKTCSHMQGPILSAAMKNVPNLRHLDCRRMNLTFCQASDSSPDTFTNFIQQQRKIETLMVNDPPRFLLSIESESLFTMKKLQLHTCNAEVLDNLVSFLDVHGHQLKQITITIRSPPSSHQKHVILVEDTFKSKNIESPSYPLVAILASRILRSAAVSELDVSDNVRLSTLHHDTLHCPLRMPGQCDACTQVDRVHYCASLNEKPFFKRPHYRAFIRAEDKLKLYQNCLSVPPRPRFKLTACVDGMALELKKKPKTRGPGHGRETLPNIMKWSSVVGTTLSNMLDTRQVPSPSALDYKNLAALEIDYGLTKRLTTDAISHALPNFVLPTLRSARHSLVSLCVLSALNLSEEQFGSVLRAVGHVLVLDVGSTFLLNLYARRKLDWFLGHFRKLRVLKIVNDDSYSSVMLTTMPVILRCIKIFSRSLKCISINNDIQLKDLSRRHMSLLTSFTYAIAEGKRVLRDLKKSMPTSDFSSVNRFYDSWDCAIFEFLDKLSSDPLALAC